jgi:energy-coupling factor transporter ATP-binding protein EcfA2
MNDILSDSDYWQASSRPRADARFDERVVNIFYGTLVPDAMDSFGIRGDVIKLPERGTSHVHALLVGTTGSGKTTVIRQLIGTDPDTERFPSTSPGKTTITDTEVIFEDGPYRGAVTFREKEEVRDYVEECMIAAALASFRGASDAEVLRRLLNHVSQRFRMNYILGNGPLETGQEDFDDEDEEEIDLLFEGVSTLDTGKTAELLARAVRQLGQVSRDETDVLRTELGADRGDERVIEEIFEENLDHVVRQNEDFQQLADELMDEIERRFETLAPEDLTRTKQGWPYLWSCETQHRQAFLKSINRFSSNHFRYFGTLLSPLVNGIRVAGPFIPTWEQDRPRLVLFDIEGLGHTPDSTTSIPTSVTRRMEDVDAILLVDSAAQPMQAAPEVVMRSIVRTGHAAKLLFCFTHMDLVKGDNLGNSATKRQEHVLASAENVLASIGQQLGPFAERNLRQRLRSAAFFVGDINRTLGATSKRDQRTIDQFSHLTTALAAIRELPPAVPARPVYDRINLAFAVKNATETFTENWESRLGFRSKQGIPKAHWATLKALTRRLAEGWNDHYGNLMPVADLHGHLATDIFVSVQSPVAWTGGPEPTDDEKQIVFQEFAEAISKRLLELTTRRVRLDRAAQWQNAYNQSGRGSTFERAAIIRDDIYAKAAPVPDATPSPDRNEFLKEVLASVQDSADELGIKFQ